MPESHEISTGTGTGTGTDFQKDADKIALSKYAPPSVVVNADLEILQFRGRTVPYLENASGLPTTNLFKMARPELLHALRVTIQSATKHNKPARQEGLSFELEGKRRRVNIEVIPANPLAPAKQRNFVVFFEELSSAPVLEPPKGSLREKKDNKKGQAKGEREQQSQRISQLEHDFSVSKQSQQSMAEEFEATQEELTSANEELQSTNEEHQSTNEELETAKEELQSSNEELTTVNDELKNRNANLIALSDDLNNLLSSVEIPILIVENDHRIRRFTPKAESAFKLIASDVGRQLGDIKSSFDLDLDALVTEVITSLVPQEKAIQDRDGRWMRIQIRPYKTIDNRIDGAVIAVIDIDALKLNEQALRESEKRYRELFESIDEGFCVIEKVQGEAGAPIDFRFLEANPAFETQTGLKDVVGKTIRQVVPGESEEWLVTYDTILKTGEPIRFERGLVKQGRMLELYAFRTDDKHKHHVAVIFKDITERKRIRTELVQLFEKEKEARTDAEMANRTKDEFIATLSHELRTPLASILSWSQVIPRLNFDPAKLKHGIKMIEESATMLGQLIDDLLDITRIRSGKLSINFTEVNPSEPVNLCIEAVRPMADDKRIVIESEIKTKSEKVWGDPDRLKQIVWNLLTNAIKFSVEGGVIRVQVEPVMEKGAPCVSIKIIDQGKGINPEFLPKLFERFSQADSSSIRIHGGLGLGLAIVRDLVQLQGSTVRAESEGIGKGATFTVLLPIKSETFGIASEAISPLKNKSHEDVEPVNLAGLSVMLVEDDSKTLDVVKEVLNSFGAKTLPFRTVSEALAAFEKFKPDVLISDISMPGEDGLSLIRRIRNLGPERCGDVPALALTAFATEGDVKRALAAGFNSHMAKPFDTLRFGRVVAELAKRKQR